MRAVDELKSELEKFKKKYPAELIFQPVADRKILDKAQNLIKRYDRVHRLGRDGVFSRYLTSDHEKIIKDVKSLLVANNVHMSDPEEDKPSKCVIS